MTSLVVLKYCRVRVDVMVPHVLANEAPAVMVVHVDTRPWIDYRLD